VDQSESAFIAGVSTPRLRSDWSSELVTLTQSGPNLGAHTRGKSNWIATIIRGSENEEMMRRPGLLLIGPLTFTVMCMLGLWSLHHLAHVALPGPVVLVTPVLTLSLIIIGATLWVASKIGDCHSR
jgi:hypothetical protein